MSYDLCFWRELPGPRKDPRAVYDALVSEQEVEGLLPFPIADYLAEVVEAFPSAVREQAADLLVWQSHDQRSMFEITWSPVHVHVTLRAIETDQGNRLVDIAGNFGAPLYDPQTGERFDTWIDA